MGFLKFLKREKKEGLDELDLPPAPPPLGGFEESMPELPDFGAEKLSGSEMPEFDFPKEEEKMPEFPSFQETEEASSPIQPVSAPPVFETAPFIEQPMPEAGPAEPEQSIAEESPQFTQQEARPRIARRLFHHERQAPRMASERKKDSEQIIKSGKTVYVRVDEFKMVLGNINIVRKDIKKSDDALMKLENIKLSKDKSFDRVKASLEDLQKKLIFVDKTLFKGDGNY